MGHFNVTIFTLGPFRLDARNELLWHGTEPLALGKRAVALLRALVERPGELVSKDTLIEAAWPGQIVEENNLSVQIAALRQVLGTAPDGGRWIETMPRRGYRFVGPVVAGEEKGVTTPPPLDVPREATPIAHGEAERRRITAISCEPIGVGGRAAGTDLEDLREVVGSFRRCVSETVGRHNGFLYPHLGNNALVLFGYPEAHEDDAEQAVRAGLELCAAVRTLSSNGGAPLRCRIGIATGTVIISDPAETGAICGQGIVGDVPGVAAQLLALVPPDTVAIDPATRHLVGNLFQYRELGAITAADGTEPVRCSEVLGENVVESRFKALRGAALSPLVGRDEEIDLLLRRWARAKTGDGQTLLVSGEAGIGKSRLTEALVEWLQDERHTRLRYFCSPHHKDSSLHPFIAQLERAAGFAHDDSAEARLDKLMALIAPGARDQDEVTLIADLLSLPSGAADLDLTPQRKRKKLIAALLHQLDALARQQPVLMVVEDLHWIDPSSRELLDLIVEQAASLPVLLILTFRSEFQAPWIGLPQVTALTLNRLHRRNAATMVERIACDRKLPDALAAEIVERADGVPLFLEEVTKVVLEAAVSNLDSAAPGLPGSLLSVPATLQASLMARIDRLGTTAREVAQVGAAIGREFSYELLLAVAPRGEAELRGGLASLSAAGLLFQHGEPPAADYRFKHSLVQETAYDNLLRSSRQALHARIAGALQERFAELVERSPEILAHHLTEAGDLDVAAAYWLQAGRRAMAQSANLEAVAHLSRGIAALSSLTETAERTRSELELQLALGPAMLSTRGYRAAESRQPYHRAAELSARLGDDRARFAASWGRWITTHGDGREDHARLRYLVELGEIADRIGDPELSLQAHHSAWATWIWSGEFLRSRDHVRQGLALYEPDKHCHHALMYGGHDPGVCGKGQGAVALWVLGYPDQAVASAQDAIALAESLKHMPSILHAVWFAAAVAHLRRDVATTRTHAERLLTLGGEHGLKQYQALGGIFRGWALTRSGKPEDGLAELRTSLGTYGAGGWTMLALCRAMLAEAELTAGHVDQAEETLADSEEEKRRWWWAEFLRLRGDLQRQGAKADLGAVEEAYREAIAIAREQQAKSLELRVAARLAGLWREADRRGEARDLLAPVYGWFTEGLATPDLKEAKALLDTLR